MNVLSVILARGGSKGLPEKNIKEIGNLSLVERAIRTSSQCKSIEHTVVSSDSEEIIMLSNKVGNFAPFKRPGELARDDSNSLDPLLHALSWSEKNWNKIFDHIVLLEPTCPFRLPKHIEKALKIHVRNSATSTVSLIKVSDSHPIRMKKLRDSTVTSYNKEEPEVGLRRQDQEDLFIRNGAVYVFSRETLLQNKLWGERQHGFVMDSETYGINIDSEIDLLAARAFYEMCKRRETLHLIE